MLSTDPVSGLTAMPVGFVRSSKNNVFLYLPSSLVKLIEPKCRSVKYSNLIMTKKMVNTWKQHSDSLI